jgi:hypothetical protein
MDFRHVPSKQKNLTLEKMAWQAIPITILHGK